MYCIRTTIIFVNETSIKPWKNRQKCPTIKPVNKDEQLLSFKIAQNIFGNERLLIDDAA